MKSALVLVLAFAGVSVAGQSVDHERSPRNDTPVALAKRVATSGLALLGESGDPSKRSRRGKIRVTNLSDDVIDVYFTFDDPDVDWFLLGTVAPGRTLKTSLRKSSTPYLLAGVLPGGDVNAADWGPSAPFTLGRRFAWTLTR